MSNLLEIYRQEATPPVPATPTSTYLSRVTEAPRIPADLVERIVDIVDISPEARALFDQRSQGGSDLIAPDAIRSAEMNWYGYGFLSGFDLPGPVTPGEQEGGTSVTST